MNKKNKNKNKLKVIRKIKKNRNKMIEIFLS